MNIIKQGTFTSLSEIGSLRIMDFNRCNGLWENNPVTAMETAGNLLIGNFKYTIVEIDMSKYPERSDWPGWSHVGNHEPLGRMYWNCFFSHKNRGTLKFSDLPDFDGTLYDPRLGRDIAFYGDIGMVSASTFLMDVVPRMHHGDLWISVPNENTQIILEALCDIGIIIRTMIVANMGIVGKDKAKPSGGNSNWDAWESSLQS